MEDFATFHLTFAVDFVEIIANFATPAANFATRSEHISHSRYLCSIEVMRQISKTHLLSLAYGHCQRAHALRVKDKSVFSQAVCKVTGNWSTITTYLCFGNLEHVYNGRQMPIVRVAPKLCRKVCGGRRKVCDNFHKIHCKSQMKSGKIFHNRCF